MKKNRILVTGATGFIGQHLIAKLRGRGLPVNAMVRNSASIPTKWHRTDALEVIAIKDIAEMDHESNDTRAAFDGVHSIVHLAGLAHLAGSGLLNEDAAFERANAQSTQNLVRLAEKFDVRTFVYMSSLAAITPNRNNTVINDATNYPPPTAYGRSKKAGELSVRGLIGRGRLAISLRPPLVVGTSARGNWSSLLRLASTGLPLPFLALRQKRNFIDVDLLADTLTDICSQEWDPRLSGEYCIADRTELSVAEIIALLRQGMRLPPRLFYCPQSVFVILAALAGRQQQIGGLIGPLRIDASRFWRTFRRNYPAQLHNAIRKSGEEFVERRGLHAVS